MSLAVVFDEPASCEVGPVAPQWVAVMSTKLPATSGRWSDEREGDSAFKKPEADQSL